MEALGDSAHVQGCSEHSTSEPGSECVCECACVQRFEDNLECPFSDATRISFVFQIFFTKYFLILSFPNNNSQILPNYLPSQLNGSLSLKTETTTKQKPKIKTYKQENKRKKSKQNKKPTTKQSKTRYRVPFALANYSWTWGQPGRKADIHSGIPSEKTDFSLHQQVSLANSFLVRGETSCPLTLLCPGILSSLNLC